MSFEIDPGSTRRRAGAFLLRSASGTSAKKDEARARVQGEVMSIDSYPGWRLTLAWLFTVALAGLIYFAPVTRLVESLSDHPATITAIE
jgi:hypothetical protein